MDAISSPATALMETQARAFVAQHLGDTIAAFPAAVRASLVEKFVADYCDPRTRELELVLRKRLTDDEVRHLLFAPMPAQYRHYAALLSLRHPSGGGDEDDATTWQFVLCKRFLTLFYFKHARNWPLVVEFVLHDGLHILADLFLHRDLQLRGQAIDSFVQITSNPAAFEWFGAPVGYEARALHAKMVALAAPRAAFLHKIVANVRLYERADGGDATSGATHRLPGGTFVLLQVLAFFLSWVRKFYTHNELRLSRELLELLRDWWRNTQSELTEELELAQQVYDDFSRWPAIEEQDTSHNADAAVQQHVSVSGDTTKPVFSPAKIDELLRRAEEKPRGEDEADAAVEQAIALCSEAIDASLNTVDARLCRARVYAWRATTATDAADGDDDDVQQCLQDCRRVLELEPRSMDAWRCQLRVLETKEMWDAGRDLLDAWHERQEQHGHFLPGDVAFLREKRSLFGEKAHETQRQQHARASREHQSREAKEKAVLELLLQRSGGSARAEATTTAATPDSQTTESVATPPQATARPAVRDVLARFKSSPSVKKLAPLGGVVQARAFVRKFAQCKKSLAAIRSLLLASEFRVVAAAVESALPDESLVLVLEAASTDGYSETHAARLRDDEAARLERVVSHLVSLPRFSLMREMAPPSQQQTIDRLVLGVDAAASTSAWAA